VLRELTQSVVAAVRDDLDVHQRGEPVRQREAEAMRDHHVVPAGGVVSSAIQNRPCPRAATAPVQNRQVYGSTVTTFSR